MVSVPASIDVRHFYPTPKAALLPLIPHQCAAGIKTFAEPCRGEGDLVRHLESFGLACVYSGDIRSGQDAFGHAIPKPCFRQL